MNLAKVCQVKVVRLFLINEHLQLGSMKAHILSLSVMKLNGPFIVCDGRRKGQWMNEWIDRYFSRLETIHVDVLLIKGR